MKKLLTATFIAAAMTFATTQAYAGGVKVGVLKCRIDGGVGFIIGSSKGVDCVFDPSGRRADEHYTGTIGKLGLDIGVTNESYLAWIVFAPGKVKSGALKGSYTGASAEATLGLGLGANALIGGFRKGINLQPLSVQAQTGLNIAAGIASLNLRSAR